MFRRDMGLQFFIKLRGLFPLGIHVIMPCRWVMESCPTENPKFIDLIKNCLRIFQKYLNNSPVKPSEPGL